MGVGTFAFALAVLLAMLGYIFYRRGKIQEIVRVKTNTQDIRSATFIDLFYGLVLLLFKFDMLGVGAKIPMSTTWVFLGMLAGREVALRLRLDEANQDGRKVWTMVFSDLGKATIGLVVRSCSWCSCTSLRAGSWRCCLAEGSFFSLGTPSFAHPHQEVILLSALQQDDA